MRFLRRGALSLCVVLVAVSIGCNRDDSVRIGVIGSGGSFAAVQEELRKGATLAAEGLNRRKAPGDSSLEIEYRTAANASELRTRVGQLVRAGVSAIVMTENLVEAGGSRDPAREAGVPVLTIGDSSRRSGNKAGVFRLGPGSEKQAAALANWLTATRGITDVSIAAGSGDAWSGSGIGLMTSALESKGTRVASTVRLSEGIDYLQPAQALQAAGAQAVIVWAGPAESARLVNAIRTIGWDVQLAGPGLLMHPSFRSLTGRNSDGFVAAGPTLAEEKWMGPDLRDWFLDYHDRFTLLPIEEQRTLVAAFPLAAVRSFDAVSIVAEAVRAGKSDDPRKVGEALRRIDAYEGLLGKYDLRTKGGAEETGAPRVGRFLNLAVVYDVEAGADLTRASAFYKTQVSAFYVPQRYLDTAEGQKLTERVLEDVLTNPETVEFFTQYTAPRPPPGPV
ncbi:MAG TPA: ABC transporter substrate-binding protein [Actinomycetota bacterium]|nr:ABC transporter substrate-binding protein [Actinomycetota bacterium]